MEENENQNPIQNDNFDNFGQIPPTQESNPVQNRDNFYFTEDNKNGNGKKKKGMGPIKGLLVALFIVALIFFLGLLIRMVIVGDNDYFKPIKDIFGIEDKEEPKASSQVDLGVPQSSLSGERYTLLVSDAENENVGHYRMTIDLETFFNEMIEQMSSTYNNSSSSWDDEDTYNNDSENDNYFDNNDDEDENYYDMEDDYYDASGSDSYYRPTMDLRMTDNDDIYYDDSENNYDTDNDLSNDEIYSDDRFRSSFDNDDYGTTDGYDSNESLTDSIESLTSNLGAIMSFMGDTLKDIVSGEVYVDVYFEENELVQVVFGIDYGDMIPKIYDYLLENSDDEELADMESQGVNSAEDLADYLVDQLQENVDVETVVDEMFDDEETKEKLNEAGLKKSDLKEVFNVYFDRGIFEYYITGTSKINKFISEYLESDEFEVYADNLSESDDFEIDSDNVFESFLDYAAGMDEFQNNGIELEKIN